MDEKTEARFAELAKLEPGWLDGMGLPTQRGVADRARAIIETLAETPRVFPTPGGGINLEWSGAFIEIEVRPDNGISVWIEDSFLIEENDE